MRYPFDGTGQLIIVQVRLIGPASEVDQLFALDTGASCTSISAEIAETLGYDLTTAERVSMTTGTRTETGVPRVRLTAVEALGNRRVNLPVTCHTLPPEIEVDGVLGLDFFRRQRLIIDFFAEQITLEDFVLPDIQGS